jgi:hypothetical protein
MRNVCRILVPVFLQFSSVFPTNYPSTIAPYRPLRCAIALIRLRIVTSLGFKFWGSSLSRCVVTEEGRWVSFSKLWLTRQKCFWCNFVAYSQLLCSVVSKLRACAPTQRLSRTRARVSISRALYWFSVVSICINKNRIENVHYNFLLFWGGYQFNMPVLVAERSKACTVFPRSEAGIVGSNPTQGMDVWYVYVFILSLCCPVFRQRPCNELITRPRSATVCKMIIKLKNQRPGPKGAVEPVGKN